MAKKKKTIKDKILLACDFETTVWTKEMLEEKALTEQPNTEVWSAATARLYSDYVHVDHSISDFFRRFSEYAITKSVTSLHGFTTSDSTALLSFIIC